MEFCEEIAILQSAFSLAQQIFPNGLENYTRNHCESAKIMEITSLAVHEVTRGLHGRRTEQDNYEWNLRILSVLLAKLIARESKRELDEYWEGALNGLPEVNLDLVLELVKEHDWNECLIQILSWMNGAVSQRLTKEIMNVSQVCDLEFIADLIRGIALNNCVELFESSDTNQDDNRTLNSLALKDLKMEIFKLKLDCEVSANDEKEWAELCAQCIKMLIADEEFISRHYGRLAHIFLMTMNLLLAACKDEVLISDIISSLELIKEREFKKSLVDSMPHVDPSVLDKMHDILVARNADFKLISAKFDLSTIREDLVNILNLIIQKYPDLFDYLRDECWPRVLPHVTSRKGQPNYAKCDAARLSPDFVAALLSHASDRFPILGISPEIYLYTSCLSENMESTMHTQRSISPSDTFELAHFVVKERLPNFHEYLDWMLEKGYFTDKRWFNILETSKDQLNTSAHLGKLVRRLHEMVTKDDRPRHNLKQFILERYQQLSRGEQDKTLRHVHQNYNSVQLFSVGDAFDAQLTTIFNQLGNAAIEKSMNEMAPLFLQSLEKTLCKLITSAIEQAGQQHVLSKVLGYFPCVSHLQPRDSDHEVTVLCTLLHQALLLVQHQQHSHKLYNNALRFIHLILQDDQLNKQEFLKTCILPYLNINIKSSNKLFLSLPVTLKLFGVLLDTPKDCDWLIDYQPIPIMLCLCEVIGCCGTCLDEQDTGQPGVAIKEIAVSVLEKIVNFLRGKQNKLQDRSIDWLYVRLEDLPWTAAWYLQPLIDSAQYPTYQLRLPRRLAELVSIPNIGECGSPSQDAMLSLYEWSSISDHTSSLAMALANSTREDGNLYHRTVAALVQVLPNCTHKEWERVGKLLCHMISNNIIVPQDNAIPMEKEHETVADEVMRMCHLLHDTILLWSHLVITYGTMSLFSHMIQGQTLLIKKYCVSEERLVGMDTEDCVCVVVSCFHFISHQVEHLPHTCSDQLFVLALDMISMFVKYTRKYEEDVKNKDSNSRSDVLKYMNIIKANVLHWSLDQQTMIERKLCGQSENGET